MSAVEHQIIPCHCLLLRKAARHVSLAYHQSLAQTGLKTSQFSLLGVVAEAKAPLTVTELADSMVLERSTLGRNIRPLMRQGWLKLRPGQSDGRRREIYLTVKGRAVLAVAADAWRGMQRDFEQRFGPARAGELRQLLLQVIRTPFLPLS